MSRSGPTRIAVQLVQAGAGSGYGQLALIAPTSIGGVTYGLSSIKVCTGSSSTNVTILSSFVADSGTTVILDDTDRTPGSCYTVTASRHTTVGMYLWSRTRRSRRRLRTVISASSLTNTPAIPASPRNSSVSCISALLPNIVNGVRMGAVRRAVERRDGPRSPAGPADRSGAVRRRARPLPPRFEHRRADGDSIRPHPPAVAARRGGSGPLPPTSSCRLVAPSNGAFAVRPAPDVRSPGRRTDVALGTASDPMSCLVSGEVVREQFVANRRSRARAGDVHDNELAGGSAGPDWAVPMPAISRRTGLADDRVLAVEDSPGHVAECAAGQIRSAGASMKTVPGGMRDPGRPADPHRARARNRSETSDQADGCQTEDSTHVQPSWDAFPTHGSVSPVARRGRGGRCVDRASEPPERRHAALSRRRVLGANGSPAACRSCRSVCDAGLRTAPGRAGVSPPRPPPSPRGGCSSRASRADAQGRSCRS